MGSLLASVILYAGCIGVVQQGASLISGLAQGVRRGVRRDIKGAAIEVANGILSPLATTACYCQNAVADTANALGDGAALIFKGVACRRLSAPIDQDQDSMVIDHKATVPAGA